MKTLLLALLLPVLVFGQSVTLDSEWDTVVKINTATTDQDFLVQDGSVASTGIQISDIDAALTAGTTQTQGGGLALTAQINNVSTVDNENDTVVLAAFVAGSKQTVYNNGANILQVFPASGDDLGAGVDTATTVGVGQVLVATGLDTTSANTVVSVPENIVFTEKHAASHTLTASECYGAVYYVTSAATLTLPAVADGMSLTVCTVGAIAVSVDPNASDLIVLDGITTLGDGDKATNLSTAGDIITLTYYDATGWYGASNSWTDGGP